MIFLFFLLIKNGQYFIIKNLDDFLPSFFSVLLIILLLSLQLMQFCSKVCVYVCLLCVLLCMVMIIILLYHSFRREKKEGIYSISYYF